MPATEPRIFELISSEARRRPPTICARRPWQRMVRLASTWEWMMPSVTMTFSPACDPGVLDELRVQAAAAAHAALALRRDALVHDDVALGVEDALADAAVDLDVAGGLHREVVLDAAPHDHGAEEEHVARVQVDVARDRVDRLDADASRQHEHLPVDLRGGREAVLGELHVLADLELAVPARLRGDDGARDGHAGLARLGGDLAGQQLPGHDVLDPADVLEVDPAVLLLEGEALALALELVGDPRVGAVARPGALGHDDRAGCSGAPPRTRRARRP